jgi:hypothetical protein
MFLPLLQMVGGSERVNPDEIRNLSFYWMILKI